MHRRTFRTLASFTIALAGLFLGPQTTQAAGLCHCFIYENEVSILGSCSPQPDEATCRTQETSNKTGCFFAENQTGQCDASENESFGDENGVCTCTAALKSDFISNDQSPKGCAAVQNQKKTESTAWSCSWEKKAAASSTASPASTEEPLTKQPPPALNIPIPGLTFTDTFSEDKNKTINVPWIAQYTGAMYKFLIGVGIIIAVITMMVGGIQWMTAGGSGRVSQAKEKLQRATMGLVMLLGSYLILYTINPDILSLQVLTIGQVPRDPYKTVLSSEEYKALTGQSLPKMTNVKKSEILKQFGDAADKAGLPRCLAETLGKFESGGNPAVIGHDENFPRATRTISARIRFLHSGVKKSGTPFKKIADSWAIAKQKLKGLKNKEEKTAYLKTVQVSTIYNDDGGRKVDPSKLVPPDYGIDWRYSHGFGIGQITSANNANTFCTRNGKKVRGIKTGGKCFSIPELLTIEGGLNATVARLSAWYKKPCWGAPAGVPGTPQEKVDLQTIKKTIANWGAGCTKGSSIPWASTREKRFNTYKACIANGGTLLK